MDTPTTTISHPEALNRLLADPNALSSAGRMELARGIEESFRFGRHVDDTALSILRLLASDPGWQVRKVVADALIWLEDEDDFQEMGLRLAADDNSFVKGAAERAFDRRRKFQRLATRQQRATENWADQFDQFRRQYGDGPAAKAMELGDRRYNQLAAALAHDLRSILTHLKSAAGTLAHAASTVAEAPILRKKSAAVVDSVDLLERCVIDVESYSEPLSTERRAEELADLLACSRDMAIRNLQNIGYDVGAVAVRVESPDGLRIRVTRHLIVLALANVIKNSIESFMTRTAVMQEGQVAIRAEADAEDVRIVVSDNGIGMSAKNLRDLRAMIPARLNKAKRKSTGFGLPIAQRYVAAHGGRLAIDSKEDVGTTVTVSLPRNQTFSEEVPCRNA